MKVFFTLIILLVLGGCATVSAEGFPDNIYISKLPRELPDLNFKTLSGEDVFLSDYRGQVVLINFWASWCAPCLEEMPDLNALQKRFHDRKIKILAVTIEQNTENAKKFFAVHGIDALTLLHDPSQIIVFDMGFEGIPGTLIINAEGKEVAQVDGVIEWLSEEVSDFLLLLESKKRTP